MYAFALKPLLGPGPRLHIEQLKQKLETASLASKADGKFTQLNIVRFIFKCTNVIF